MDRIRRLWCLILLWSGIVFCSCWIIVLAVRAILDLHAPGTPGGV